MNQYQLTIPKKDEDKIPQVLHIAKKLNIEFGSKATKDGTFIRFDCESLEEMTKLKEEIGKIKLFIN